MDALCRPPAHYTGQPDRKRARLLHIKHSDAGGYAARYVPRIRRHREGIAPMEMVAADVRHSDIMVKRPDGSLATPKMIVFLDLATNRIFARVVLLPKGEMIGRKHVLAALRDMMADRAWGVPRILYIDNGSEFSIGAAPDTLASLATFVRDARDIELGVHDLADLSGPTGTIRSRPYNPQSKVIEGVFSTFTRSIEPMFQGFVGGNRMAKKVENQGRAPVPMKGDAKAIENQFAVMVDFYNARQQQRGAIKGRSPNEAFTAAVDAGWGAVVLNPREFELTFGPEDSRLVQTGGELHFKNRIYRADALAVRVGERVTFLDPILLNGQCLVVLTDKGEPDCIASEDHRYAMRDLAGVHEHDRRRRDLGERVALAAAGTERLNLPAEMAAYVQANPKALAPVPVATASIHPLLSKAAAEPVGAAPPAPRPSGGRSGFAFAASLRNAG